jgi:hypothetical protein
VVGAWKINEDLFKGSKVCKRIKITYWLGYYWSTRYWQLHYSYLPRYYFSSSNTAQYQFGSTFYGFLRPAAYDPNIKWETTDNNKLLV